MNGNAPVAARRSHNHRQACSQPPRLAGVVCVHVGVSSPEVAPLEAVDGAQVTRRPVRQAAGVKEFSRPVAVPDVHALVG